MRLKLEVTLLHDLLHSDVSYRHVTVTTNTRSTVLLGTEKVCQYGIWFL
jgi:hypothetical protein